MKMFNLNCPSCGAFFYGELLLSNNKLPLHCPGCDRYLEYEEYSELISKDSGTSVARINRPLNTETIPQIIYRPKK